LYRKSEEQSSVTREDAIPPSDSNRPAAEVLSEVTLAEAATARLRGYDGSVVDDVTAVTSSDLCSSILVFVDRVVQIGDVISQVTNYFILSSFLNCHSYF
jgi:hypothetical protein